MLVAYLGNTVARKTFNTRETGGAVMATVVLGSDMSTIRGGPDLILETEARG